MSEKREQKKKLKKIRLKKKRKIAKAEKSQKKQDEAQRLKNKQIWDARKKKTREELSVAVSNMLGGAEGKPAWQQIKAPQYIENDGDGSPTLKRGGNLGPARKPGNAGTNPQAAQAQNPSEYSRSSGAAPQEAPGASSPRLKRPF
ncbi:hypothetical protein OAO01_09460 [Oligoflexia bacterium]|nr:hypothetical protein [Oligoflexia bacterium]